MHRITIRLGRHEAPRLHIAEWTRWLKSQRPRHPKGKEDGVLVEPNRPNTLGGGAAAPLDFDE